MKQQGNYNVGIYCRLSKDDYNTNESSSITSQKAMLTAYIQEQGWNIIDYYVDDGWSGTTFQRPDFIRMINDIDLQKIDMVITKDLSRLGRDYIITGHYVEVYFPQKNVRYIALNDGIDTINDDNDIAPFKNILNEMYAKDISKKVRSALKLRASNGEFLGGYAPYGYTKDPNDKHKLLVDREVTPIIQKIFTLFLQGHGAQNIATTLNKEEAVNPIARLKAVNPDMFKAPKWNKTFYWRASTIKGILRNMVYLGHMVNCKLRSQSFKSKRQVSNEKEDWIIVENTHEPIISKEVWDEAQKMLEFRRRPTKQGEPHIFSGLLKCPDCGSSFVLTYNHSSYKTFICRTYKVGGVKMCSNHNIRYDILYDAILSDIKYHALSIQKNKEKIISKLMAEDIIKRDKQMAKLKNELKHITAREIEIDNVFSQLYEDKVQGVITNKRFIFLTEKFDNELEVIETKKQAIKDMLMKDEMDRKDMAHWINLIEKYTNIQDLSREILHELIECIYIGKKTYIDKEAHQDIRIVYKFVGEIAA